MSASLNVRWPCHEGRRRHRRSVFASSRRRYTRQLRPSTKRFLDVAWREDWGRISRRHNRGRRRLNDHAGVTKYRYIADGGSVRDTEHDERIPETLTLSLVIINTTFQKHPPRPLTCTVKIMPAKRKEDERWGKVQVNWWRLEKKATGIFRINLPPTNTTDETGKARIQEIAEVAHPEQHY